MELTPPWTSSESSIERERSIRRRRIVNSSSEGSEFDARLNIPHYFLERYRAGIPGVQQLPLTAEEATDHPNTARKIDELRNNIYRVLRQHDVQFDMSEVELVHRSIPGEPLSSSDLTLLIGANWRRDSDGQAWLNAANAIKNMLVASSSATRNVKVELLSWQLRTLRTIAIVELHHPLVSRWQNDIKPSLLWLLESTAVLRMAWTCVDVLRMGYLFENNLGGTQSATPVTIAITVDYGLIRKDWYVVEQSIRDFLEIRGFGDVEVEFQRGDGPTGLPFYTPEIRETEEDSDYIEGEYPVRVPMGADFGPEKYFTNEPGGSFLAGPKATIGGYLEVRRNKGPWTKYAVTNYNCVREAIDGFQASLDDKGNRIEEPPKPKSLLHKTDRVGLGPNHPDRKKMTFECPTRRTHRFSLQWHDQEIQRRETALTIPEASKSAIQQLRLEIADHRERRARKVEFFDQGKQKLGHLFLCSGFKNRTSNNHRIDIALIEVNSDRIGDNTLPNKSAWSSGFRAPIMGCGTLLQGIASCRVPETLRELSYKVGCCTGANTGRFNHIQSEVKFKSVDVMLGLEPSSEFAFVSQKSLTLPWTEHGDSGSMVWQEPSKWLGVVWGGGQRRLGTDNKSRLSYIIDAQDVIEWIEGIKGPSGDVFEARLPAA
ncbi:MAG: hypothetical protein Q9195_001797 [Heterodermia aff. obscurata]